MHSNINEDFHQHLPHVHAHSPQDFNNAFIFGIGLNIIFITLEVIYGLKAHSLALLTEAGHAAGDVIGLFISWGALLLTKHKPSERFTYGFQSASIIAALLNAIFLLLVTGGIIWETMYRFYHPEEVASTTIIIVSIVGIFINGVTACLFLKGSKDLNIRGAFLHMASDALICLGVLISAILIAKTGKLWIDPVTSLIIAFVILIGTWGLLKESIQLSLYAAPKGIELSKIRMYFKELKGVKEVHDLHIWAISTSSVALSVHLVMPKGHPGDCFINDIIHTLEHNFSIHHATIQIEIDDHRERKCISTPYKCNT